MQRDAILSKKEETLASFNICKYVLILYLIQQTYAKQTLNALHRMMYMINRGKFSEEIESHLVRNDHCYHCTNQLVGKYLRIVAP